MLLRPARRALTVWEPPPWLSAGATIIARSAVLLRGNRQEPRTIALIGGRASSDGRFLLGLGLAPWRPFFSRTAKLAGR